MSILYDMRSGELVKSKLFNNGLLLEDTLKFDPMTLFKDSKQGVWYDPSDLTTLFKDAVGTQPVTADGDPVGLRLDKSKGLVFGGNLATPDKWVTFQSPSVSFTADTINFNSPSASNPNAKFNLVLTAGAFYKFEFTVSLSAGASVRAAVYSTTLASDYLEVSENGSYSVIFKATAITIVGFRLFGVGSITNIKVRQIAGNHAMQTVSAKRPIYRTDGTRHWLKHDLVDDDMMVSLPAMTTTTAVSSDDGTAVNYPVSIAAGNYTLGASSTLGRDYGRIIVNADLSASEQAQLTQYLNSKRGA